ncbi:MAG: hypothetical protein WCO68_08080 [Verrucomicrobiota bacterium]
MSRKTILYLFAVAFLIRSILSFVGFDRRPLLMSNDEVSIQDAAYSLACGEGLRASSLDGLDLGTCYYHYPPLSFFVQAALFRSFGFSPATLRLPSIMEHSLGLLVLFWILRQGVRGGLMDAFGAWIGAALILVDPFLLVLSRVSRMEHLCGLLGLVGMAFAFAAHSGSGKSRFRKLLAGSVFIGLALGTHPAAVSYQLAFACFLALWAKELGWRRSLAVFLMPGVVFGVAWGLAFGRESLDDLWKMSLLSKTNLQPSLGLDLLANAVFHHKIDDFKQLGASAYLLVLAGWLFLFIRCFAGFKDSPESRRKLCGLLAIAGVLQIGAAWKMTFYSARTMLYAPLAIINLAIVFSFLPKMGRRVVTAVTVCFALAGAGATVGYFHALATHWNDWSSDRFAAVVESVPKEAKVASTFELWYAWRKANRHIRVIVPCLPTDRPFWTEAPERFAGFDVVIFSDRSGEMRDAALKANIFAAPEWIGEKFTTDEAVYFIYRKIDSR